MRALAFVLLIAVGGLALAHGQHRHGVAELRVAVDGSELVLHLESPLDDLLGFERPPRTASERAAAQALLGRLKSGEGLFTPTPAAGCTLASATVDAPVLQGGGATEGHATLTAEWRYRCLSPDKLTGIQARLFRLYPRLQRLEVAVAGPRGQRAARLSARHPDLTW